MRPFLLLVFALFAGAGNAESINGHNYVSLASWAKANGFGGYTLNRASEYVLTNKTMRLVFTQDDVDSVINGIQVRLSFPVAKGGYISQLDAEKTLRPLVFPQRLPDQRIRTICLDPGHGGKDTGNRVGHVFPHYEKTYTLALALELQRQLEKAGFKVILTRDKDVYPDLSARPDLANRRNADLFVSLHFNSSPSAAASVEGVETYSITPVGAASSNDAEGVSANHGPCAANRVEDSSLVFAYEVQRSIVKILGSTDRSVRRARYEVLRTAQMPAILIEGGYMSHPTEGRKIFEAAWRKQLATAIVHGILNYQKLTAPPSPRPVKSTTRAPKSKKRH